MASLIYIEYFYQYLLQEEYVFNTGLGEANIYIYIKMKNINVQVILHAWWLQFQYCGGKLLPYRHCCGHEQHQFHKSLGSQVELIKNPFGIHLPC